MHARVEGIEPGSWEDPSLVQVWGPRFSAYVVAERDRAVFTLGRLPDDPAKRRAAEQLADQLEAFLDGRRMKFGEAGRGIGKQPNFLRYAAPTGRVVMRWDGARQPTIWMVPPPAVDAGRRSTRARRAGTSTSSDRRPRRRSASGPGSRLPRGRRIVRRVGGLADAGPHASRRRMDPDGRRGGVPHFRRRRCCACAAPPQRRHVLPSPGRGSGTACPRSRRRGELWTPRVWPGAVLVNGEVAGTWRRAGAVVTIQAWRRLSSSAVAGRSSSRRSRSRCQMCRAGSAFDGRCDSVDKVVC